MKKYILLTLSCIYCFYVFGQSLSYGNLVVVRVGNGIDSLTESTAPVFLELRSLTSGTLNQTISMPTVSSGRNRAFTLSGNSTTEGLISYSADGKLVTLAGYDAPPGMDTFNGLVGVDRVLAKVDASGVISTSTVLKAGSVFANGSISSTTTKDGSYFFAAGQGDNNTGGVYFAWADSVSGVKINNTVDNANMVHAIAGTLYATASSGGIYTVSSVGAGYSNSAAQSIVTLPGLPNDSMQRPFSFQMLDLNKIEPGLDVMYVVDTRDSLGGIYKFSLVSGTWMSNGKVPAKGLIGLAVYQTCKLSIDGYATNKSTLFRFNDNTGYNQTIVDTLIPIVHAPMHEQFRGVTFSPNTAAGRPRSKFVSFRSSTCYGVNDGSAYFYTEGGVYPYGYYLDNNISGGPGYSGLAPGQHYFIAYDMVGCRDTTWFNITQRPPIVVEIKDTGVTCYNDKTGILSATIVSGVDSGYSYFWEDSSTNLYRNNLSPGKYLLTVTNADGCKRTFQDSVQGGDSIKASFINTEADCGIDNGVLRVMSYGGYGSPYQYSWSDTANQQSIRSNLRPDYYEVMVTDKKGCSAYFGDSIYRSSTLKIKALTQTSCIKKSDASIQINIEFYTPPVNYIWADTILNIGQRTSLPPGIYSVSITDALGCSASTSVSIFLPDTINIVGVAYNPSCQDMDNGAIYITTTGGTPGYNYDWGFSQNEDVTYLTEGSYSVTVTDSAGCKKTADYNLVKPAELIANAGALFEISGPDSVIIGGSPTASGGIPPYFYSWTPDQFVNMKSESNPIVSGIDQTTVFTVDVKDSKGCHATATCTVRFKPTGIQDDNNRQLGISTYYQPDGSVVFTIDDEHLNHEVLIDIYTANGQVICSNTVNYSDFVFVSIPAVCQLSNGVYLAKFTVAGKIAVKSFLLNR